MLSKYDRLVDGVLLLFLVWITAFSIYRILGVPELGDLKTRDLVVQDVNCSGSSSNSSLLIKAQFFADQEFKLVKTIRDCSEVDYSYLIGEVASFLVSESNALTIWQMHYDSAELMSYEELRHSLIRETLLVVALAWGFFGVVYLRRKMLPKEK